MKIENLNLSHFRNVSELSIEFGPKINVFIGGNGHGKTNILEGIYLLTQGESFRYGNNDAFISHHHIESALRAKIKEKELEWDLKLQIYKTKTKHLLNEKKITAYHCAEKFPIILFSPESLSAIKEGDEERRKLVDSLLVTTHPELSQLVNDYKKILKTRNSVLKNHLSGNSTEKETKLILESLNLRFLNLATDLTLARIHAIREIISELKMAMKFISNGTNVDISVEYVISGTNATQFEREKIFDSLHKRLLDLATVELFTGFTLVGPHKHDIKFLYGNKDSRLFCSQGQQRAMILSFKMAQIVYHQRVRDIDPVLILDDVLSELDTEKRSALASFLVGIGAQVFISTTEMNLANEIRANDLSIFEIADGALRHPLG